ncbi:hypothetical protein [Plebeiibacterium marinum]|uniref:Uncharacterized protein n=1 Tax=Plebeiibacterium marinum TaxID=2992111 RepID=A0AAE3MBZ8_9BACT|nr:hypothetical protein [Plebeiobacterium marinum]MCW3804661.1 hypothetical protein [Plebeiobacterium marinum]
MKNCIYIAIALLWMSMNAQAKNNAEPKLVYEKSAACQLFQVNDEKGLPVYYYMDINEYPSDIKECYPMNVRIYWDAWGNFLKLGFKDKTGLAKIDSEIFNDRDYLRLHELLNDQNSELGFYKLDKLSPHESEEAYYNVDAFSGATVVSTGYDCVRGAVKTCYVLWHIVNGEIKDIVRETTIRNWDSGNLGLQGSMTLEQVRDLYKKNPESVFQMLQSNVPVTTLNNIIQLVKTERLINKQLDKVLSSQLLAEGNEIIQLLVYNYLLQAGYRDKLVRGYVPSKSYLK